MMKQKYFTVLILLIALTVSSLDFTFVSKADSQDNAPTVIKTCSCTVNGTERVLTLYSNGKLFFKVLNSTYSELLDLDITAVGFDKLGTLYCIDSDNIIRWWNYDLAYDAPGLNAIFISVNNEEIGIDNVKELILDEDNNYVIGFRTFSGDTYPTLTMSEMKAYYDIPDSPTPTPTPTAPVSTPSATPKVTPTTPPKNTTDPVVTPKTVTTKKVVKKKAGYSCLSIGNKVTSKYKLAKGKLTWKGSSKSKKYSGIKSAAFIKKSGNLVFLTKKGKVYTLSPKGKKKCIVKKKGKKLILKNKFAVKVQVGKKFINIANK